jgi:hypothetical protein
MKKFVLLISACIFQIAAIAQEGNFQNRISVGPRLGINNSTFTTDNGSDGKWGPMAGLFIMYSSHQNWGFTGDVLYSSKGSMWEHRMGGNGSMAHQIDTRLDYLHIPLSAFYFLNLTDNFKPKIGIGPYISFLLNSNNTMDGQNFAWDYATWDTGLSGTVGFNYLITPNFWLNTDLRYEHGFVNLNAMAGDNMNMANRVLSLSIGLGINISRVRQ